MIKVGHKIYSDLKNKVDKYCQKYNNPKKVYLKMIGYCLRNLIKVQPINVHVQANNSKNELKIAIVFEGGIGDTLVYSVWAKEFSKRFLKNSNIEIYAHNSIAISNAIFSKYNFYKNVFSLKDFNLYFNDYDIIIKFRRFPQILYANCSKIEKINPELLDFLQKYVAFENKNAKFFTGATHDTQIDLYSICRNEKRIQQPDINNLLNIKKDSQFSLPILPKEYSILNQYNLENEKYITISRGIDSDYDMENNVRLWKMSYFEELIKSIKNEYPQIKFVQLGVERCNEIADIDVNLLGKTDFEQLKIVLKNSILHIDGECGLVHLKHFLNGSSAVLFAQTAIEYLGYENNINLKSDGCSHWCEWIVDDWQNHCIRGFKEPPCMTELKPDYVFEQIKPFLNEKLNKPEKTVNTVTVTDIGKYFENNQFENSKIIFFGKEFFDFAKTLSKNNSVKVFDYDLDWKILDEAKKSNVDVDFADIYNLPLYDEDCDVVVSRDLSSFENSEFAKKELSRILKNKKTLLIKE